MKKKTLLVSGDSYTEKDYISMQHPKLECSWPKWPEILAEKLDMNCINLAMSGAGQEYIYSTLIDKLQTIEPSDIGLCIAAWSSANRRDYKSNGIWRTHIYGENERPALFYKEYITDLIDRSIIYFYTFQNLCENLKIPYKQVGMLPLFQGYYWQELMRRKIEDFPDNPEKQIPIMNKRQHLTNDEKTWLSKGEIRCTNHIIKSPYYNMINHNFIGWPTAQRLDGYNISNKVLGDINLFDKYRISEIDTHPNAKGQEAIAKFIYEQL